MDQVVGHPQLLFGISGLKSSLISIWSSIEMSGTVNSLEIQRLRPQHILRWVFHPHVKVRRSPTTPSNIRSTFSCLNSWIQEVKLETFPNFVFLILNNGEVLPHPENASSKRIFLTTVSSCSLDDHPSGKHPLWIGMISSVRSEQNKNVYNLVNDF